MTPGELNLLRAMLREEIDTAIKPVRTDVAKLAERTKALEETDRRHDRTFAPRASVNDARRETEDAMTAAGSHIDKVVHSVDRLRASVTAELGTVADGLDDLREQVIELEKQNRVKVTDAQGTVSMVPASTFAAQQSTVAAQAATSAEGKITSIAVDAHESKQDAAIAKRWAKYGPLITVLTIIVSAIVRGLMDAAPHGP